MQKKSLKELKKGDIIRMRIPFEENTPDYYNGYSPQDIRGDLYTDKNGQASKNRYVVVIGRDKSSVQYLPLTSRHSRFDGMHQYELEDNSMTYKKEPDMRSYVEVDSLRSVYVNPEWEIHYQGRAAENDMANIMVRLGKSAIDFNSQRDQRAYVSQNKETAFNRRLQENGYSLSYKGSNYSIYNREDGRVVTRSKWGLVKYHVPLPKEEVARLVARHEGKPEDFYLSPLDDFVRAVAGITDNKDKESGVMR